MVLRRDVLHRLLAPTAAALTVVLAAGCDRGAGTSGPTNVERAAAPPTEPAPPPAGVEQTPAVDAAATVRYEFDPPQLDFGILRPQQSVEGAFKLRNLGTEPLQIRAMKATCACTELEPLERRTVPPGEQVEIHLTLSGRASGGTRNTAIDFVLEGADRKAARAQYTLIAEYARSVRSIPGYIRLSDELKGTFKVEALDGRPFRVLSVLGLAPDFVAYDPASGEPRTSYELRYDFTGYDAQTCENADGARMPSIVAVETDHPGAPLLDIVARHRCTVPEPPQGRTWYIVSPGVNLGVVLPGEPIETEVEVKWLPRAGDRTATIHAALSESPGLDAKLLEVVPTDLGYTCRLQLTPGLDQRGLLYARVRLHSARHSQHMTVVASVRDDLIDQTALAGD